MKLAGKYATLFNDYTPDFFPNQQLMHSLANRTNNTQLKEALLDFQYPFKLEDLKSSGYSPEIMQTVLNAVVGMVDVTTGAVGGGASGTATGAA
jgi:hypothetical protein